jgi:hypothetical protein
VAGLLPGFQDDFPFIVYAQSVPRPPWSGNRDFHREKLLQVYEFLIATPVAEIQQEDETAGNTADAFEARGCFAVCEADLCADVVSTASS